MNKKIISGIFAVMVSGFLVSGISAASDSVLQAEGIWEQTQEEDFADENEEQDSETDMGAESDEIEKSESEEEPAPEIFEEKTEADIIFEQDLPSSPEETEFMENSEEDSADEEFFTDGDSQTDTVKENDEIPVSCGEITVTEKIREQDIVWEHGIPVFRFVISGTDQKGLTHTYENYVEFKNQNYEKQGEYAVLSHTFHGIPLGEYTISEKETLRYQFQRITANTSNIKTAGKKGIAVLNRENKTAAVTFDNIKTRYDGYSHTDVVRNTIPLKETE